MKKRYSRYFRLLLASSFVFIALSFFAATAAATVTITEPRFGVANQSTFNVTATTSAAATCKYSSPFEKPFAEMIAFTETGTTTHKLLNFNLPDTGQQYKFFVECLNDEKGNFDLSVDSSPPLIVKAAALPQQIIETPLETGLVVETNENASCKYDAEFYTYDTMRSFFKTNDVDKANYESYHEATISSLTDKTNYAYNVSCRNLAQLTSPVARITFSVDTSVASVVTELKPPNGLATASKEINLSVTTNKKSVCSYGNTTEYKETGGNFSLTTVNHQVSLKLEPRQYRYYVKCLFEGPKEATAETSFAVDDTPPSALEVNDSQELKGVEEGFTYYLDRMAIKFKAEDAESGIDFYNYSIVEDSTGKLVHGWTTASDSKVTARDLNLKDGEKYYVQAYAQNRAGLKTAGSRSRGVTVNVLLNTEYACSDSIKDGDETDVDCGGSCSAKCPSGKACGSSSDCRTSFCVSGVCKAGNCTDGYINQDETDTDCGGSCSRKCDISQKCKKNTDCETSICSESVCIAEGPCSNKRLDEGETDVDCGGLCVAVKSKKCSLNQKCAEDSDCRTGLCGPIGKCVNQNDRDADTVLNDADNCPDMPNKDQKDLDKDKIGDACDKDNDNDGMPDEWEKKYGFNPLDGSDALLDSDGDGLTNLEEFGLGTSPKNRDTDRDGVDDGKEAAKGTDPKDPKSKPGMGFVARATIFLVIIAIVMAAILAYSALKKKKGEGGKGWKGSAAQLKQQQHQPQQQNLFAEKGLSKTQQSGNYNAHRSPHHVFDELQRTYSQLSGEELFEQLRRKSGRR